MFNCILNYHLLPTICPSNALPRVVQISERRWLRAKHLAGIEFNDLSYAVTRGPRARQVEHLGAFISYHIEYAKTGVNFCLSYCVCNGISLSSWA